MNQVDHHIEGLPFHQINQLLPLKLQHGTVHVSVSAIRHISERHHVDANICLIALPEIIRTPDWVGQSPYHSINFELVKRIGNYLILTAISSIPDDYGDYPLQSAYLLPANTLHRRLRKRHLIPFL
jgi:hypothetical protein